MIFFLFHMCHEPVLVQITYDDVCLNPALNGGCCVVHKTEIQKTVLGQNIFSHLHETHPNCFGHYTHSQSTYIEWKFLHTYHDK